MPFRLIFSVFSRRLLLREPRDPYDLIDAPRFRVVQVLDEVDRLGRQRRAVARGLAKCLSKSLEEPRRAFKRGGKELKILESLAEK